MKANILIIYFFLAANVFSQFQQWVNTYNGSPNGHDEAFFIAADQQSNILVCGRITSAGNNSDFCTIKYNSTGTQLWAAVFDGAANQYDEPNGLTVDGDGNVYVTGMTRNASFFYDITVIKYNSAGTVQWSQVWAGPTNLNDEPAGIYVDGSGNVYVTGNTEITSNTNYNL
jgi:sugar lactone lactonase YvrE